MFSDSMSAVDDTFGGKLEEEQVISITAPKLLHSATASRANNAVKHADSKLLYL